MRVEFRRNGELGRLVLTGELRHALGTPVLAEPDTISAFLADDTLLGAVVCGEGRDFCAGADPERLRRSLADGDSLSRLLAKGKEALDALTFATVPVVAAIRGACLGAGLEIALSCHFRVAAESAMLGFPESTLGILPGLGGTVERTGSVRRSTLVDLLLSGRMIGANEARDLGLVDRVVKTADVVDEAERWILSLTAGRSARLIRAILESIHNGARLPRHEALRRETEIFCRLAREGP